MDWKCQSTSIIINRVGYLPYQWNKSNNSSYNIEAYAKTRKYLCISGKTKLISKKIEDELCVREDL